MITPPSTTTTTISEIRCFGAAASSTKKKKKPQKKIRQGKPKNKAITRKYPKRDKKIQKPPAYKGALAKELAEQEAKIERPDNVGGLIPFITATSSPHVYVASCALEGREMEPTSLFYNVHSRPRSFVDSMFYWKQEKEFKTPIKDHSYPVPEIAILGKSNVGKSSLANALMNNQKLAITSKTPGRTRQIFYFGMYPPDIPETEATKKTSLHPAKADAFIVDLPGYGFAKVSDDAASNWQQLTQDFLLARHEKGTLQRLFFLIDARRGVADFDRAVMNWFDDAQIPYSIVFTKADSVTKSGMVKTANEIGMRYHAQYFADEEHEDGARIAKSCMSPVIHLTSAAKGFGIKELLVSMEAEFLQYKLSQASPAKQAKFAITTEEGDDVHVDASSGDDNEQQDYDEERFGSPYANEEEDDDYSEHEESEDYDDEEDEDEGYEGFADEDDYDMDDDDDDEDAHQREGGRSRRRN